MLYLSLARMVGTFLLVSALQENMADLGKEKTTFEDFIRNQCPRECNCNPNERTVNCHGNIKLGEIDVVPKETKLLIFEDGSLTCDCGTNKLLDWALEHKAKLLGTCSKPAHLAGQRITDLSRGQLGCEDVTQIRKRRAVSESGEQNATLTVTQRQGPDGLPVWPCDFEKTLCQWFQLSDGDFSWTRHQNSTVSLGTGPSGDHTTGKGWYIYIETSAPQREGHKARLVSPTLRPVEANKTCQISFWTHMFGEHIGQLNVYQAPVVGHDVIKMSLKSDLGNKWVKQEVVFDSRKEFQIILEGVVGGSYRGDIALDDIIVSSGCRRIEPSYIRLSNGSKFNTGRVDVYNNGTWGQICQEAWSQPDSQVACHQLGFIRPATNQQQGLSSYGTIVGISNITCNGSESSLNQCPNSNFSTSILCSSNKTVSLTCEGIAPVCPLKTHLYCSKRRANETTRKCISRGQLCDYTNDCWDGSDETNCHNYTSCTFENPDLCGWIQAHNDQLDWTRHRGDTPSDYTGPSADHDGNVSKYYIYIHVAGKSGGEKARLAVIPRFQGNHEGLCKVRFFYHMRGWGTGALRVLVDDWFSIRKVWEKNGAQSFSWRRAEVTLVNTSRSFRVLFEAEHSGITSQGDIAIDDVSFTPECKSAPHENITCLADTFHCPTGECIPLDKKCDFNEDCFDAGDEKNCGVNTPGRCDFGQGFCQWVNLTNDDFDFQRKSGHTLSYGTGPYYDHTLGYGKTGHYVFIEASAPRTQGDKARLASPQFMWKGVSGCKLHFYYHMYSVTISSMGTLKILLKNVITSITVPLWQRTGSQGNRWIRAEVSIATSWPVSQVVIEAVRGPAFMSDIAIDDISLSPQCYPSEAVHIDRNFDVRLAGAKSSYRGRVEVYRVGEWGTVCRDEWNSPDANVVCRQLGYSQAVAVSGSLSFGKGKGRIWLDNLKCYGNETNLNTCRHNGWANHNCDHSQDATAVCDLDGGATKPVRLVGSPNNTHAGLVEVYYEKAWGVVCFDGWDLHDAHVVCRQVGFSSIEKITRETFVGSPNVLLSNVTCLGNENSLGECSHEGWKAVRSCSHGYAGVVCRRDGASEGDIRLKGGRSPKEGRVEIFHRGEWGTVCEDMWSMPNAKVVCYELGFTSVVSRHQSFGPGRGQIWLYNVRCTGNESALALCRRGRWGTSPCGHSEDIGVICGDNAYIGCFKDGQPRVMSHKASTITDLTPVKCIRYCQMKGYSYVGLEWSTECYCGSHYSKYGNASESECESPCAGDPTKKCGAPWRLSVYTANPSILPSAAPGYPPVRQMKQLLSPQYGGDSIWSRVQCPALVTSAKLFCREGKNDKFTKSCSTITPIPWAPGLGSLTPLSSPNYFTGTHTSGSIWSPRYPRNYPNRIYCVWVISLVPGSTAKVVFSYFNTEAGFDFVEIRDGKRRYDQRLTPLRGLTGLRTGQKFTATSNSMWIKFVADESVTEKGFILQYSIVGLTTTPPVYFTTTVPPSSLPVIQKVIGGCNGVLDAINTTFGYYDYYHNTGYVQSPNYPGNYPNNMQCQWTILVQTGHVISISLQEIALHSSNDVLTVGDGKNNMRLTSRRRRSVSRRFVSRDRFVQIYFGTDGSGASKGFKIKYERAFANETITNPTPQPPMSSSPTILITTIALTTTFTTKPKTTATTTTTSKVFTTLATYFPVSTKASITTTTRAAKPTTETTTVEATEDVTISSALLNETTVVPTQLSTTELPTEPTTAVLTQSSSVGPPPTWRTRSTATEATFQPSFMPTSVPLWDTTARPPLSPVKHSGLSSGAIAGVSVAIIIPILVFIILVLFLLKRKNKRDNQGVRHCFTNEAYDNEGIGMTDRTLDGNAQTTPDPSVLYAAIAPPPYTAAVPGTFVFIPANPNGIASAPASQYANLYSHPPPYQATAADTKSRTTTTAIGSVTSLRDAATDGPQTVPGGGGTTQVNTLPPIRAVVTTVGPTDSMPSIDDGSFVRRLLPPIGAGEETKQRLSEGQAGPLPEKVPMTVGQSPNRDKPTRLVPPSADPQVRTVSPSPSGISFEIEVPFEFICPITNEIMKNPVSAADGYTYERRAIRSWFRRNPSSPMTNEPVTDLTLRPNNNLRERIDEFVNTNSHV